MREILYIQAGQLSNYVGAHFWNTQEAYLADDDNDYISHETSFREGTSKEGNCYTPRVLVFDKKQNFGSALKTHSSLPQNTALDGHDELNTNLWNGNVLEYRQDAISSSASPLDAETPDNEPAIRHWPDFSRVYYHPRSFQMIPDVYDFEGTDGSWRSGERSFEQYNDDVSLMEDSVRLFLEESDSLQGIQVLNDTSTFGPFIHTFLTLCRDEMTKMPCIGFPFLSDTMSWNPDIEDKRAIRRILNDALYLRGESELVSLTVPVRSPSVGATGTPPPAKSNSLYHASAVMSAHIETVTLGLRLRHAPDDISDFANQLNARGASTPYAEISGLIGGNSLSFGSIFNYSHSETLATSGRKTIYAQRDVTRGFGPSQITAYNQWSQLLSVHDTQTTRKHAPAYPIPASLCNTFSVPSTDRTAKVFSVLSCSSGTAKIFRQYAEFVDTTLKRRRDILSLNDERDDMRELANDLWTVHDNICSTEGQVDGGPDEQDDDD
ncbi:tubulin nucleotide-binding domain-like protein [Hymenopellis radicata]|nr:tubulin nucleotide-binding domain-like protein [Hymenopellis radicata]